MRIVYVVTSLGMGGAERQVVALAGMMAESGHAVAILVLKPRLQEEWPTAVEVIYLDIRKSPMSVMCGMGRARRILRDFRPDIIHSHSFHANMIVRLLKVFVPAPVVLSTIHNVYEGGRLRMLAYRLTDRLSSRTTAVSEAVARRFVRLKAVANGKCVVLTNGIDCDEFAPNADRRVHMRAQMGVDDDFVWVTAGRIVPAKGYPNLLRAFARLRERNSNAQLWVAGEATGNEGASLVAGLGLAESVRWLGLRRDMPALLDAADGFVLGSAWEGMPLALGEAMAMEKPAVATDVGGVNELVGDAGVIVPSRDPGALAQAMQDLMRSTLEDRLGLGSAARRRILAHHSMNAKAGEWNALYKRELHCN